jgi:hypothetical protein
MNTNVHRRYRGSQAHLVDGVIVEDRMDELAR